MGFIVSVDGEHLILQVLAVKLVSQPSVIYQRKKRQEKPCHVFPHALESPNYACEWALVLWFFVCFVFFDFGAGGGGVILTWC